MKSYSSLALAAALLCHPAVSNPMSPTKVSPPSLRGATPDAPSSAGETSQDSDRKLQYADQTCYQKTYYGGGMQVNNVACSTIMGSCKNQETAYDDTEQDIYNDAVNSDINSWYIFYIPNGQAGSQWAFTVCS